MADNIVRLFDAQNETLKGVRNGVLLLQGPVGPYFGKLQRFLNFMGRDTWRVKFHLADNLHGHSEKSLPFRGGAADWNTWLAGILASKAFDTIILFGAQRPAHVIARDLAKDFDVRVICLEEGYIRPGLITVEWDGNNASSPLAGRLPTHQPIVLDEIQPQPAYQNLLRMVLYAAQHYTVRGLTTYGKQRELFHRKTPLLQEAWFWLRNISRRIFRGERNFATIQQLLEHADGQYFLVPLQVNADTNMVQFSEGWSSIRLIMESLQSFTSSAPQHVQLVFKIHPMERGHNNLTDLIEKTAATFGIADRVKVIETGSMGLLTRHAAGMITINSTSGLSAIFHGVPLLVLGRAIYRHPALAHCGVDGRDFDQFWTSSHVAPKDFRKGYLAWLKQNALKPGDFYHLEGMDAACQAVLNKLREPAILEDQIIKRREASK